MRAVIKREIEMLSKMDHPAITKVHAVYEDAIRIYVIVDTIRGGTLYEKIFKDG
jgi:serine/threonine protein kinase